MSSLVYCCFVWSAAFSGDFKSSTLVYLEDDGEETFTKRFSFTLKGFLKKISLPELCTTSWRSTSFRKPFSGFLGYVGVSFQLLISSCLGEPFSDCSSLAVLPYQGITPVRLIWLEPSCIAEGTTLSEMMAVQQKLSIAIQIDDSEWTFTSYLYQGNRMNFLQLLLREELGQRSQVVLHVKNMFGYAQKVAYHTSPHFVSRQRIVKPWRSDLGTIQGMLLHVSCTIYTAQLHYL